MKRRASNQRGLSLLELVIAASMLSLLMATVAVVLRTSRQAWEAHEADFSRLQGLHATVRHIVRQVRQAKDITQISPVTDLSGRLAVRLADGTEAVWDHNGTTVNYGLTNADQLLAVNITTLKFTGYKADGVTTTTTPADVQSVLIEASTTLPNRDTAATRTVSSWAWLRTW